MLRVLKVPGETLLCGGVLRHPVGFVPLAVNRHVQIVVPALIAENTSAARRGGALLARHGVGRLISARLPTPLLGLILSGTGDLLQDAVRTSCPKCCTQGHQQLPEHQCRLRAALQPAFQTVSDWKYRREAVNGGQ